MLPLELHGAIFVRWSESQTNLFKILIVAPADTPYGGGCFVFDVCIPPEYPKVPPKCILATTGGGRWRFNPNLYDSGKVCLSLLGTWQGEPWDEKVSNLNQLFMSIYGLIFVEEPYFNEPGYQGQRGSAEGDLQNAKYNSEQNYKSIEIAMLDQLKVLDPCFGDVAKMHFKIRRDDVLERCEKWKNDLGKVKGKALRVTSDVKQWDLLIGKLKKAIDGLE